MYRMLVISAILAGLIPPLSGASMAQGAQEGDGQCFQRIAACVEACGPVDDKSDDSCIDRCVRVELCDVENPRSAHSNLPDDDLPESSLPDSTLPADKLPDSHLP